MKPARRAVRVAPLRDHGGRRRGRPPSSAASGSPTWCAGRRPPRRRRSARASRCASRDPVRRRSGRSHAPGDRRADPPSGKRPSGARSAIPRSSAPWTSTGATIGKPSAPTQPRRTCGSPAALRAARTCRILGPVPLAGGLLRIGRRDLEAASRTPSASPAHDRSGQTTTRSMSTWIPTRQWYSPAHPLRHPVPGQWAREADPLLAVAIDPVAVLHRRKRPAAVHEHVLRPVAEAVLARVVRDRDMRILLDALQLPEHRDGARHGLSGVAHVRERLEHYALGRRDVREADDLIASQDLIDRRRATCSFDLDRPPVAARVLELSRGASRSPAPQATRRT